MWFDMLWSILPPSTDSNKTPTRLEDYCCSCVIIKTPRFPMMLRWGNLSSWKLERTVCQWKQRCYNRRRSVGLFFLSVSSKSQFRSENLPLAGEAASCPRSAEVGQLSRVMWPNQLSRVMWPNHYLQFGLAARLWALQYPRASAAVPEWIRSASSGFRSGTSSSGSEMHLGSCS